MPEMKNSMPIVDTPTLKKFISEMNKSSDQVLDSGHKMVEKIKAIDATYRKAIEAMNQASPVSSALFIFRAHSAFLAATRLASAGQVTETYPVLRACLENGLYAFYISKDLRLAEMWIKRDESVEQTRKVRNTFQNSKIYPVLEATDPILKSVLEELYDRTLGYGAHPNPQGHMSNMEHSSSGNGDHQLNFLYACGAGVQLDLCLKTCAQIAVSVLKLFNIIYSVRFKLLHLDQEIAELSKDL